MPPSSSFFSRPFDLLQSGWEGACTVPPVGARTCDPRFPRCVSVCNYQSSGSSQESSVHLCPFRTSGCRPKGGPKRWSPRRDPYNMMERDGKRIEAEDSDDLYIYSIITGPCTVKDSRYLWWLSRCFVTVPSGGKSLKAYPFGGVVSSGPRSTGPGDPSPEDSRVRVPQRSALPSTP